MKVTVRQLKALIREAAEEAMDEMKQSEEEDMEMQEAAEEEESLNEAVTRAFRAGYQRGVKAASARKAKR